MNNNCPNFEENQLLVGVPIGQYHCSYCGEMILAGIDCRELCNYKEEEQNDRTCN